MSAAELDTSTLRLTRIFDAPCERVFDAWARRDHFIQWMCPPGVTITLMEIDVRVGGAWRIEGRNESGRVFSSSGKYLEIARPQRLVFTWGHHADGDYAKPRGHETTVRIELRALGGQSRSRAECEGQGRRLRRIRHGRATVPVCGRRGEPAYCPHVARLLLLRPRPVLRQQPQPLHARHQAPLRSEPPEDRKSVV